MEKRREDEAVEEVRSDDGKAGLYKQHSWRVPEPVTYPDLSPISAPEEAMALP